MSEQYHKLLKESIVKTCESWVAAGYGDTSFWEPWPEEPDGERFTPNELLALIRTETAPKPRF